MLRRLVRWTVGLAVVLLVLAQLVPYGRSHSNPPKGAEPKWPSTHARVLAAKACFDCHSNETAWPWYASVAPLSWLIQRDVEEGRAQVNFSQWDGPQGEVEECVETVRKGEMPPWYYVVAHPEAKLSPADREELVRALAVVTGAAEHKSSSHREND